MFENISTFFMLGRLFYTVAILMISALVISSLKSAGDIESKILHIGMLLLGGIALAAIWIGW